ncbi:putative nitronate monooxygenase [Spathaspora sp. JA1]|nr:putative nitronate monooxygenase [Spathaspora sp. JA1]
MASFKLTKSLGIKYPILLSPMAGIATPALSSAITNLGGLGSIPISHIDFTNLNSVDQLDKLIIRDNSIVNLNFFCHEPVPEPSEASIENWKSLYRKVVNNEDVVDRVRFTPGKSFKEFETDEDALTRLLGCLEKLRPKVVSFHFGIPSISTIGKIHDLGILVFASATSLDESVYLHNYDIDGIVLQGFEAGGHRGNFLGDSDEQLSTQSLFAQVRDYFREEQDKGTPFLIPAGGINDASIVKYYIENGAAGVQVGTAFLGVRESLSSPFFTNAVKYERKDTAMVDLVSGKFARTVCTPFIESLIKNGKELQDKELPGYGYRYNAYKELRGLIEGELDVGFYLAGQNYYSINPDLPIEEIMKNLTEGI